MSDAAPVTQKRARTRKSGLQDAVRAAQPPADVEPGHDAPAASHAAMRPNMRGAMREEDPRARAARRTQEIIDGGALPDEGVDEFYLDPDMMQPGWTYEWKTQSVLNKEDPGYQVQLARGGWEPVPASRHPELMPEGATGAVTRKGMILMERPAEITRLQQKRLFQRSRDQVRQKEAQLHEPSKGQFARDNKGNSLVKVNKSYEPFEVPE